jgi:hypothetical protein
MALQSKQIFHLCKQRLPKGTAGPEYNASGDDQLDPPQLPRLGPSWKGKIAVNSSFIGNLACRRSQPSVGLPQRKPLSAYSVLFSAASP